VNLAKIKDRSSQFKDLSASVREKFLDVPFTLALDFVGDETDVATIGHVKLEPTCMKRDESAGIILSFLEDILVLGCTASTGTPVLDDAKKGRRVGQCLPRSTLVATARVDKMEFAIPW